MTQFTDQFAVANWVIVPTGATPSRPEDQKWHLVLSGIALFTFQGTRTGDWHRDSLRMAIDYKSPIQFTGRSAGPGKELRLDVEQYASYSTINSIYDAHNSVDAGYAVDSFRTIFATRGTSNRIFESFEVDLAVRDSDAFIYRIGYHLTLIGKIVETDARVRVPNVTDWEDNTERELCDKVKERLQAVGLKGNCPAHNRPLAQPSIPPGGPGPRPGPGREVFFVESQDPIAGAEVAPGSSVNVFIDIRFERDEAPQP